MVVGEVAGVEMATEVAEKCPVALEVSVDAEAVVAEMHPINLPFNAHEPTTTTLLDARSTFCMRKNLCCITPLISNSLQEFYLPLIIKCVVKNCTMKCVLWN